MQGVRLPAKYVNEVGQRHRAGETYEQIVDAMRGRYSFCSTGSVHRALTNWREKNNIDSPLTAAKKLSVAVIKHYESTDCTMRVGDLVEWANANSPRTDRQWDQRLISGLLRNWKVKTGQNNLRDRTLANWEKIHQRLMTGYSTEQVASQLNQESLLNYQDLWTSSTVAHFHARHARKFNVELESLQMRSENEILEIGYLVSMLRVDGYSFTECTDYVTENELYFFRGRSWSTAGLKSVYQRAREILNAIEGYIEMSAAIETRNTRTITTAAMSAVTFVSDRSYVPLRIVHNNEDDVESDYSVADESSTSSVQTRADKTKELERVARRVADLRAGGVRRATVAEMLDTESPRPGGWSIEHVTAVERYAETQLGIRKESKRHFANDHSAAAALIIELAVNRTHEQIAAELNRRGVANTIRPQEPWAAELVNRVACWARDRAKRAIKCEADKQEAERKRLIGKRPMRPSDVAVREHARSLLAKKQEAFDRATQIHAKIEALQAELARANNEVSQAMEAESLLIETGPKSLVAELVELRENKPFQKVTQSDDGRAEVTQKANEQIDRIREVTARIVAEDWR